MSLPPASEALLVHLAAGIGNVVLATPLLALLARRGFTLDARVDGDYPETADLLRGWGALRTVTVGESAPAESYRAVLPAVPPFYWRRYLRHYRTIRNATRRPEDSAFYRDEQAWYLRFAAPFGGAVTAAEAPFCMLPVAPDHARGVGAGTVVLAPGCKSGEMAAKRWPYFPAVAQAFADVVLVGTEEDVAHCGAFPPHVRSLIGLLTLRQTAAVMAASGAVVANDSGLGHVAVAVGVPTLLIFGPTSDVALGRFPTNATIMRSGLSCQPCWLGKRLAACGGRVACLREVSAAEVIAVVRSALSVEVATVVSYHAA